MKRLNVNEEVVVGLTDAGIRAWKLYAFNVSEIYSCDPYLKEQEYNRVMSKLNGDTLEVPVWKLINAFGSFVDEKQESPFKTDIKIKEKSLY